MNKKIFIAVYCCFFFLITKAQSDTLILINGKKIAATNIQLSDSVIHYSILKGSKTKVKKKHIYDVYAVIKKDEGETILYKQDTTLGFYFSETDMDYYIRGFRDGKKFYKPNLVMIGSIGSGLLGAYINFPFGTLVPALYVTIIGVSKQKNYCEKSPNIKLKNNETYQVGYNDGAHKKKVYNTFSSSGISYAVGFAIIYTALYILQIGKN